MEGLLSRILQASGPHVHENVVQIQDMLKEEALLFSDEKKSIEALVQTINTTQTHVPLLLTHIRELSDRIERYQMNQLPIAKALENIPQALFTGNIPTTAKKDLEVVIQHVRVHPALLASISAQIILAATPVSPSNSTVSTSVPTSLSLPAFTTENTSPKIPAASAPTSSTSIPASLFSQSSAASAFYSRREIQQQFTSLILYSLYGNHVTNEYEDKAILQFLKFAVDIVYNRCEKPQDALDNSCLRTLLSTYTRRMGMKFLQYVLRDSLADVLQRDDTDVVLKERMVAKEKKTGLGGWLLATPRTRKASESFSGGSSPSDDTLGASKISTSVSALDLMVMAVQPKETKESDSTEEERQRRANTTKLYSVCTRIVSDLAMRIRENVVPPAVRKVLKFLYEGACARFPTASEDVKIASARIFFFVYFLCPAIYDPEFAAGGIYDEPVLMEHRERLSTISTVLRAAGSGQKFPETSVFHGMNIFLAQNKDLIDSMIRQIANYHDNDDLVTGLVPSANSGNWFLAPGANTDTNSTANTNNTANQNAKEQSTATTTTTSQPTSAFARFRRASHAIAISPSVNSNASSASSSSSGGASKEAAAKKAAVELQKNQLVQQQHQRLIIYSMSPLCITFGEISLLMQALLASQAYISREIASEEVVETITRLASTFCCTCTPLSAAAAPPSPSAQSRHVRTGSNGGTLFASYSSNALSPQSTQSISAPSTPSRHRRSGSLTTHSPPAYTGLTISQFEPTKFVVFSEKHLDAQDYVLEESAIFDTKVSANSTLGQVRHIFQKALATLPYVQYHLPHGSNAPQQALLSMEDLLQTIIQKERVNDNYLLESLTVELARALKELPEKQRRANYEKFFEDIKTELSNRKKVIFSCIEKKGSLLRYIDMLEDQMSKLSQEKERLLIYLENERSKPFMQSLQVRVKEFVKEFSMCTSDEDQHRKLRMYYEKAKDQLRLTITQKNTVMVSPQEFDRACRRLRRFLFAKCYSCTPKFSGVDAHRDSLLNDKIRELRKFITPTHLEIPPKYAKSIVECKFAQEELTRLEHLIAAEDKINCISKVCHAVFELMKISGDAMPAIDDFLPMLLYVIIKVNPPNLFTNIQYCTRFLLAFQDPSKDFMFSLEQDYNGDYWMRHFEAAALYLESVDVATLAVPSPNATTTPGLPAVSVTSPTSNTSVVLSRGTPQDQSGATPTSASSSPRSTSSGSNPVSPATSPLGADSSNKVSSTPPMQAHATIGGYGRVRTQSIRYVQKAEENRRTILGQREEPQPTSAEHPLPTSISVGTGSAATTPDKAVTAGSTNAATATDMAATTEDSLMQPPHGRSLRHHAMLTMASQAVQKQQQQQQQQQQTGDGSSIPGDDSAAEQKSTRVAPEAKTQSTSAADSDSEQRSNQRVDAATAVEGNSSHATTLHSLYSTLNKVNSQLLSSVEELSQLSQRLQDVTVNYERTEIGNLKWADVPKVLSEYKALSQHVTLLREHITLLSQQIQTEQNNVQYELRQHKSLGIEHNRSQQQQQQQEQKQQQQPIQPVSQQQDSETIDITGNRLFTDTDGSTDTSEEEEENDSSTGSFVVHSDA